MNRSRFSLLLSLLCLTVLSCTVHAGITANSFYKLKNRNSGGFLAVEGGSMVVGARLIQWRDQGQEDIIWQLVAAAGGYYQLKNAKSGLFLAVEGGQLQDGARILQQRGPVEAGNWDELQWLPVWVEELDFSRMSIPLVRELSPAPVRESENHYYRLGNHRSGLLLAVESAAKQVGAQIVQWQDLNQKDVEWQFIPVNRAAAAQPKLPGGAALGRLGGADLVKDAISSEKPLWGWADLHAHPASHLAFGADADGNNGIIWGKPGLSLDAPMGALLSDLPACAPDKHGSFDADLIRHKTHLLMIEAIDSLTGHPHMASGAPTFADWPNARSLLHQQMHVTALRRAYDGGQRLMIASTTNNQMLSLLWQKVHYDPGGALPLTEPDFDYRSAKRQIDFIKQLVAANPSWMEVSLSAAEARRIISANKMAIILGVEMDSLTPEQVLRLVAEDGVRHVVPIHLINNAMGGCAVYSDAFNAANNFINGGRNADYHSLRNDTFFTVQYDANIHARLGRPQTLVPEGFNLVQGGAVWPRLIDDATFARLGYDLPSNEGGHRNTLGLTQEGKNLLQQLAKKGVLIDVAHMSQNAMEDTLGLPWLTTVKYPLMDSHTGLRAPDETAENERALMRRHAQKIAELGGMIGLGTEGTSAQDVVLLQPDAALGGAGTLVRFTGDFSDRSWRLKRLAADPVVTHLTVKIKTGGDDLRGGNNGVWAWVTIGGRRLEFDLSKHQGWRNDSLHTVTFELPAGTRLNQIDSFALHTTPNAKNGPFDGPDNWNVDELRVEATFADLDPVGQWLREYRDVLALLKGRGAAFGTDLNGFAPQIPFCAQPVIYPLTVASRYGTPPAHYSPYLLGRSHMGSRTFDFRSDGIAHYGMLPDFMQSLSQQHDSEVALDALFRTAGDVVVMWEKCEAVAGTIR